MIIKIEKVKKLVTKLFNYNFNRKENKNIFK